MWGAGADATRRLHVIDTYRVLSSCARKVTLRRDGLADLQGRPGGTRRGEGAPGAGEGRNGMPDTSSARRHAERPPLRVSGLEPVDGTWFETGDEPPVDLPLIMLVPRLPIHGLDPGRSGSD